MTESSLIKLQVSRTATLLKRDPAQVFSCEICQIFQNTLFYCRFPACNFIKKRLRQGCFSVNFAEIFKNIFSFDRAPPDGCFLYLFVKCQKFSRTLLLESTSGKLLFYVQVAEFRPPETIKNYFTGAFQAF